MLRFNGLVNRIGGQQMRANLVWFSDGQYAGNLAEYLRGGGPNLLNRRNEWLSTARMSKRIAALAAEKGGVGTGDWHHQGRAQQQDSRPCR
ncbi:hypothetical protein CO678_37990 [Bradyrhizobium diazoefficiens]|nr:hypothetical protein CO678_37990 [Bradyrhizobium diazoefficiens]